MAKHEMLVDLEEGVKASALLRYFAFDGIGKYIVGGIGPLEMQSALCALGRAYSRSLAPADVASRCNKLPALWRLYTILGVIELVLTKNRVAQQGLDRADERAFQIAHKRLAIFGQIA